MINSYKARLTPPVYTIVEVDKAMSNADRKAINKELENAGSNVRVFFEKPNGIRLYAVGHPYLDGVPGGQTPLFGRYLVVNPNGSVTQTNNVDQFRRVDD